MIPLLGISSALGATLTVAADGSATYDTIADAVAAASAGDTIEVAAGTYVECVETRGVDLDFVGAGASSTVIDGNGMCANTVLVKSGETVTLSGFTLTNVRERALYSGAGSVVRLEDVDIVDAGSSELEGGGVEVHLAIFEMYGGRISDNTGSNGGGLFAGSGSTVTIEGVTISNNRADDSGGGIYIWAQSTLVVRDSAIVDNIAPESGGGIGANSVDSVEIDNSTIEGNTAEYSEGGGMAVSGRDTVLLVHDTEIVGNDAAYLGGGASLDDAEVVEFTDSVVQGNTAGNAGGGLMITFSSSVVMRNTRVEDNSTSGPGGGVYAWLTDTMELTDSVFQGNAAGSDGGGIYVDRLDELMTLERTSFVANTASGSGGGLYLGYHTAARFVDGEIRENVANRSGGGLRFEPPHSESNNLDLLLDVSGTTISDNTAERNGGGIYVVDADLVRLQDNDIFNNQAGATRSRAGGGLLVEGSEETLLVRNHFCGNLAGTGGGVSVQSTTMDSWRNNLFTSNVALDGGGAHRDQVDAAETLHNSFLGNSATSLGGALYMSDAVGPLEDNLIADTLAGGGIYADDEDTAAMSPIRFNAWSDNVDTNAAGWFAVTNGDEGNIVVNAPGLLAWSPGMDCASINARLAADSPLRDSGDPEGAADLDGSVSDIGAYGGPDAPVEDYDGDGADTTVDCLDVDATVFPGADDVEGDGIDQDCDGVGGAGGDDADSGETAGCGCGARSASPRWVWLSMLGLLARRRSRAPRRVNHGAKPSASRARGRW